MVMGKWGDYSGGRPTAAALKAAGYTGVIRYIGLGSAGKRITNAEYQDLTSHGLQVLLVAELNTHDAEGGYQAGRANATTALADARILGIPDTVGIAAACDEHLTGAQIPAAVDYARGFQDIIGRDRCGIYGFIEFTTACKNAGVGSWYWRCGTKPSVADQQWTHFWQRNTGVTQEAVAGITVDINDQLLPVGGDDMTPDQNNMLASIWNAVFFGGGDAGPESIIRRLEKIENTVGVIAAGGVDVDALAAKLSATLGADVAQALGQKLVS